jgi:methylthioribose-1-phosphate isomerase
MRDVTLLCDNAAGSLMAAGGIDLVMVGTDRVAANGDVINKIGTLALAVLCRHFDIPFYVACPASTFDAMTPVGSDVVIENRSKDEIIGPGTARVPAYNPAFDVTPAALVTALITDCGMISYPPEPSLAQRILAERR